MMAPSDGRGLDDGAERGLEVFQEGGRLVARQAGWGMMEQSSLLGDTGVICYLSTSDQSHLLQGETKKRKNKFVSEF